ncbi:MAG TPA: hypothetical protein VFS36_00475 [Chitinophagaceae bacterium]|jgi:hypothetical protein|nr:hypothetical protein [Chitinophagaceae bacterium]
MDHLMYTITPLYPVTPTWERVYQSIKSSNEEARRKQSWKAAVDFLYGEFGKGFFDTCGHNHPISLKLTTNLFQIDDLVEFTEALATLKKMDPDNYSVLLDKLRPRKKCQAEGIPFSDILRTFSKQGFNVKFLKEIKRHKTPDIELIDTISGESIFVEVSQLKQSSAQQSIQEQHRVLSNTFLFYGYDLPKACKQLQPLEGVNMDRTINQIKLIKDQAASSQELVAYEDEFIRMAVAHPNKLHKLDEWCAKRNIKRNSMEGLPVDYNDTRRLVDNSKIEAEIKQLPADRPGFVYIPVSFLYFLSMSVPDTVISIMDQLVNFPHCIGVSLYAPSCGTLLPEGLIEVGNTRRSIKTVNGITRHLLFIGNSYFNQELSSQTLAKFHNCLI